MGIYDPVQIFFAFIGTPGPTPHPPKEPRMPFYPVGHPQRGFLSLPILDHGLLVGREIMVAILDGLRNTLP